jgi:hypothetical protein
LRLFAKLSTISTIGLPPSIPSVMSVVEFTSTL